MSRARVASVVLAVVTGLIGAWLGLRSFGSRTETIGPFTTTIASSFGAGETEIALPPVGEVHLDTHDSPIHVRASVADVDIEGLAAQLEDGSIEQIANDIETEARTRIAPLALRTLGIATLGSLVAGALVFRRRWRLAALSMATGLLVTGVSLGVAWRTFNTDAFAAPRFEGTLRLAPRLLGPAHEVTERLDEFRANLERIVGGAVQAYSAIEPQTIGGGNEIRVLHISDVHLNTLGLDFAVELARGFDVDLVIDTGDLTSYGTPVEEAIASQIPRFRRPYVFVRGNHDPPAVGRRVDATRNGRTLEGRAARIGGLRIFGAPHPVFTEDQTEDVDSDALEQGARDASDGLAAAVDELDVSVDLVAVHDDRMAGELAGDVPVVLSGHFHRSRASTVDGTLYLRAGSTGGAGVNMFGRRGPVPLSATVLYFERGDEPELIAYDLIEQSPTTGRLTIQRHLVADAPEATPSPQVTPRVGPPSPTAPPG